MKITIDTEEKVCFLHECGDAKLEDVVNIIKKINGNFEVGDWSIKPYKEDYSGLVTYPSFPQSTEPCVPTYPPYNPYCSTTSKYTGDGKVDDQPDM